MRSCVHLILALSFVAIAACSSAPSSSVPSAPTLGAVATQAAPTVAAAATTASTAAGAAGRSVNVGIVQFTTHPALDASRDGARKALEDAGFKEGQNARYDVQNAQGQIPTLTTIAQRYR